MSTENPLDYFGFMIYTALGIMTASSKESLPPYYFKMKTDGATWDIYERGNLEHWFKGKHEELPAFLTEYMNSHPDELVAVCHESWLTPLPHIAPHVLKHMLGGRTPPKAGKRMEVWNVQFHTVGSQQICFHPIIRTAQGRKLHMGNMMPPEATLGGRLVRDLPTRH